MMLAVVLYLAMVRATVHVWTKQVPVSAEFVARIAGEPQSAEDITGLLRQTTAEITRSFSVEGEGEELPAKAHGSVTLTNDTASDQPLVATTRLLSKEGVLFRLIVGVTVPAKGSLIARVQADQEGKSGEVAPTSFTIPGLPLTKQKLISAISTAPMVGGTQKRRVVRQEDLDRYLEELVATPQVKEIDQWWTDNPLEQAGLSFATILSHEILERKTDVLPGQEAGTVTMTAIVKFTGLLYDRGRLDKIAQAKLEEHIAQGQRSSDEKPADLILTLQDMSLETGIAHLAVQVSGGAVLQPTSDSLKRARLAGLTADEAVALLLQEPSIEKAEVTFKPFFVRHIPKLEDHIEVLID